MGGFFMNLRDIRYLRFNSVLVRHLLGLFYRAGGAYRIWFGPLRGLRMRYDLSVNFHAILGLWDTETFKLLDRVFVRSGLVAKDSVVVDVGGNIGYYTMWLCTVAAEKGFVYSFEPSTDVVQFLRDNLALNNITNAEVIESACGNHVGTTEFFLSSHHHISSIHAKWAGRHGARRTSVAMTTLDAFFAPKTARRTPAFIKFDIEGGGTDALPGCRQLFREARPFVLIESHMPEEDRAISNVLCEFNYCGYRLDNRKWVKKPDAIHPEEEGVWGTVLLVPAERHACVAALIGT
jgi:FkbM family methyltransferase